MNATCLTVDAPPVGGSAATQQAQDKAARQIISRELGHEKTRITAV